jgi:hypothetical protein
MFINCNCCCMLIVTRLPSDSVVVAWRYFWCRRALGRRDKDLFFVALASHEIIATHHIDDGGFATMP